MESADEALSACLLQWVQSFEGTAEVHSLHDLDDGLSLWSILNNVDETYFHGPLPEPNIDKSSDWTRKWQNLKHIEKQVATYYRDICNGQEQMGEQCLPDVQAIAAESSILNMNKLLMAIIRAAMASPESNQKMAQRLMSLGRDNAMMIAEELRSMDEAEYTESEPVSRDDSADHSEHEEEPEEEHKANGNNHTVSMYQDPLLEREERLLQAQATIDALEAKHTDAQRQLDELRQEKERIEGAFDAYRNEIDTKGRKGVGDESFKKLQRQTDNDRAYIENLEGELQSSRTAIEKYEVQLQRYKDDNEMNQKLKDEVQLLKADNADLNQKMKANENLKKKIQALQEQEKTNSSLREEIKEANEGLEGLDRLKRVQASLEKEIIEKQGLIRNQEYQINELTTTRKHAEHDARVLAQKLQEARERHDRDHVTIQDLRRKTQGDVSGNETLETLEADRSLEKPANVQPKAVDANNDESKHLSEKVDMLQQQLETADIRLKQISDRNAVLEEKQHGTDSESDALKIAEERVQEQEHAIANIRKELEAVYKQKKEGPPPAQDVLALQRENHLMATAWYDLSSRLQNNGVSLSRRRQEPKSWIANQRAQIRPNIAPVWNNASRA